MSKPGGYGESGNPVGTIPDTLAMGFGYMLVITDLGRVSPVESWPEALLGWVQESEQRPFFLEYIL